MVAPRVEMWVGTVALPCGVISIHSPVKVLVLGNPDVGGEDLDGQRVVGRLLSISIKFCRSGVAWGMCGHHQLTFPSKGLRGLQGLAGTHRVLGWRVLPPLQTGQHGEVGTVLQPGEFCGQP